MIDWPGVVHCRYIIHLQKLQNTPRNSLKLQQWLATCIHTHRISVYIVYNVHCTSLSQQRKMFWNKTIIKWYKKLTKYKTGNKNQKPENYTKKTLRWYIKSKLKTTRTLIPEDIFRKLVVDAQVLSDSISTPSSQETVPSRLTSVSTG